MTDQDVYILGSSDLEHRRLMLQARILRPWTERFLRAAGLVPGMSVLDLGSGMGDVSMLTAGIVGPRGRVVGIDRDPVVIDKARRRGEHEGFGDSLAFDLAALEDFDTEERFDAVVGRFVLLYQPDPAGTLRRFARFLRPGGVMVFHEIDLTNEYSSWPPSPVWDESYRLLAEAYRRGGTPPDFGRRLTRAFLDAGLPSPTVECLTPVGTDVSSPVIRWVADSVRSLAPVLERTGLSLPEGLVADDTLPDQLEKAVGELGSQIQGPVQYGAWARKE
ncbi:class I SAM-dependent methyltransferase [Streptomyces sp. NPDC057253]|uniref:class I SAM-dependent methyltransferase n=1 Tax=Streptomyces sp. NPDC057253 TaxID=3346069 RepID=UPI00363B6804